MHLFLGTFFYRMWLLLFPRKFYYNCSTWLDSILLIVALVSFEMYRSDYVFVHFIMFVLMCHWSYCMWYLHDRIIKLYTTIQVFVVSNPRLVYNLICFMFFDLFIRFNMHNFNTFVVLCDSIWPFACFHCLFCFCCWKIAI